MYGLLGCLLHLQILGDLVLPDAFFLIVECCLQKGLLLQWYNQFLSLRSISKEAFYVLFISILDKSLLRIFTMLSLSLNSIKMIKSQLLSCLKYIDMMKKQVPLKPSRRGLCITGHRNVALGYTIIKDDVDGPDVSQ